MSEAPDDLVSVVEVADAEMLKGHEAIEYVSVRIRGAKGSLEREPHLLLGTCVVDSGVLERERECRRIVSEERDGCGGG